MTEEMNTEAPVDEAKQEAPVEKPSEDSLPDWARESLGKARDEAYNYRTKYREAQEQLAKAKTPEEFQAVVDQLNATQAQIAKDALVEEATSGLPKDLVKAPWVAWPEDKKGIQAVAEQLRSMFAASKEETAPKAGGDLAGGLNPNENANPAEDYRSLTARVAPRRW